MWGFLSEILTPLCGVFDTIFFNFYDMFLTPPFLTPPLKRPPQNTKIEPPLYILFNVSNRAYFAKCVCGVFYQEF